MRVFDCFLFFNELDLLEIRLASLYDQVDFFVIVESDQTFQGESKPFNFEANRQRFLKWMDKIVYYKIPSYKLNFVRLPYHGNPVQPDEFLLNKIYGFIDACPHFDKSREYWWGNDFYQRECIRRALLGLSVQPDDLILLSDLDEIPRPEVVTHLKEKMAPGDLYCLEQAEFCYYLNYFHNSDWLGTIAFRAADFEDLPLNSLRFASKRDEGIVPKVMPDAGWHFTSLGGIDSIRQKIKSWGHKEFNNFLVLALVKYNVERGYDIFRRPDFGRLSRLDIRDSIYSPQLGAEIGKFPRLIGPVLKQESALLRHVISAGIGAFKMAALSIGRVHRLCNRLANRKMPS